MSTTPKKLKNPLVNAAARGWRRHFLASSLRAVAATSSPPFKLRKRVQESEAAAEEPPAKRQKVEEVPEESQPQAEPAPVEEEAQLVEEDDMDEDFVPADVAIQDKDPDGKSLVEHHLPKSKWSISCTVDGCKCDHCGPARAQVCCMCEHDVSKHVLSLVNGPAKENITVVVARLFDLVRAARAAVYVFQFYHWVSPLLARIKSESSTLQHNLAGRNVSPQLKGLLFAFSETLKKLPTLPSFEGCKTEEDQQKYRVEMVILFDSLYWEMYHYSSVAKIGLEKKIVILPPDQYFDLFSARHLAVQGRKLYTFVHQELGKKVRKDLESRCDGDLLGEEDFTNNDNIMLRLWRLKFRETVELFYTVPFLKTDMSALLEKTVMIASKAKRKHAKHIDSGEALARGNEQLEEPICFDLLQRWRDVCRDWPSVIFAYAVPNKLAIQKLVELGPIVEIGAGTGWWAHTVQAANAGTNFVCYDTIPPCPTKTDNEFHGNRAPFVDVMPGDAFKLLADPMNEHRTLFLCYPPPKDAMAIHCLQHYMGTTVVHVGEWEGFTGSRDFETKLCTEYQLMERIELPNWADTAYFMTIWKKKSTLPAEKKAVYNPVHLCTFCQNPGVADMPLLRCRFCRATQYCSKQCLMDDVDHHERVHKAAMIQYDGWINFYNALHFTTMRPL